MLAGMFLLISGYTWPHMLLSLAVFGGIVRFVYAMDENTKRNKK